MPGKNTAVVEQALQNLGLDCPIVELPETTRTAREAAKAIDCDVAQIAKSIIFRGRNCNDAILVVASGRNRIDTKLVAEIIGESIEKADANFVRQKTGFTIGGVPPLGHKNKIQTLFDRDLAEFEYCWAAAGTPYAVFQMDRDQLNVIADGKYTKISQT